MKGHLAEGRAAVRASEGHRNWAFPDRTGAYLQGMVSLALWAELSFGAVY